MEDCPLLTVVCIGTGPSLALEQIDIAREKGYRLFGCNNAFAVAPDLELLYAVNLLWWDHYYNQVRDLPCEKWTTNYCASKLYSINHMREREGQGMCLEDDVIHHGHGSGYSLVSMAHKKGATRVLLLGYDLRYPKDYNGFAHFKGTGLRHSELVLPGGGEYPAKVDPHFPKYGIEDGVLLPLVALYQSIHEQGEIEIINCSPGSALEGVIPSADIRDT